MHKLLTRLLFEHNSELMFEMHFSLYWMWCKWINLYKMSIDFAVLFGYLNKYLLIMLQQSLELLDLQLNRKLVLLMLIDSILCRPINKNMCIMQ